MTHPVAYVQDTQSFWKESAESLLAHESEYSLMIGRTLAILSSERTWSDVRFFTVRKGSEIVGQAMHTGSNKSLLLSRMSPEAVQALVEATVQNHVVPDSVRGPAETAERCALALARHQAGTVTLSQRQGLYELREVLWPTPDGGSLVCGAPDQQELALRWMEGFVRECFPDETDPGIRAEDIVKRRLEAGHLYFWKTSEGEFVSMAGRNRETPRTTSISLVYTPPDKRGRGHARSVVAHLSQLWLDRGKESCNLFTNLANPKSNRAYVSVGYVQLLETRIYSIEKA